ncbi:hypothetical protein Tco_0984471 [Tanacetum coccineum]
MQACTIDRIMFSQLLDILVDKAEEEAKSPYLRSSPLKSRPFRNDMKGNVLFTDMYCAKDEGFEMTMSMSTSKNDASKYVEYIESITDGRNEGMNQADDIAISKKRKVVSRGNSISIRENDGHNVALTDSESDCSDHSYKNLESDSDQSDKSFNYLSDGENKVIELRKRMRQSKVNGTEVPDEVPRDEGTFAQGQYTTIDVDRFGEVDDTCVGLTPLIREHEKFTEALLRKLKGNGVGIIDPFAILEDSKEKYPIYVDLTHRKLKKPKLGEKFPTVDKFKECLTYYALANGFSLYFERSNKEKIVAKCGQRKEVIKDPNGDAIVSCCKRSDGRVYNVGRFGFNKKKKFGSSSTCHVKMRGGKIKGGRLFPAQRLGRMGSWLGIDGATSDTIKETKPYQPSKPVIKNPLKFSGTHQLQVSGVGSLENCSLPPRKQTRSLGALQRTRAATVMGGVQTTNITSVRGGTKTRDGTKTRGTSFILPRLKSQRILNKKVSKQDKGTRSSNDNDNVQK